MAIKLCSKCYVFEKSVDCGNANNQVITVGVNSNNTNYTFWMTDKFGNYWLYTNTSSNTGELTLNLNEFSDTMFTEFSGSFEVTISLSEINNVIETFEVDSVEYECFVIKFVKTNVVGL